jgi:hypothetical protein
MYETSTKIGQLAFVVRFPGGVASPGDAPGAAPPPHARWAYGAARASDELLEKLEERAQQIGQLELAAAISPFFSMGRWLRGRDVIHYIDNTAAAFAVAKGYSSRIDSAKIIHAFHALNLDLQVAVDFRWVQSEANIADLPSRGDFKLLEEWGATRIRLEMPSNIDDWMSPEDAAEAASRSEPVPDRKPRGGRRGKAKSA